MTYARGTEVPADRSRAEIENTLKRFGADQFMYGYDEHQALIAFRVGGRHVRFVLPLPTLAEVATTKAGYQRNVSAQRSALPQVTRERWRALALAIKAKLTVVEVGIATFEEEFMAHVVLPDGQTVGQWMTPQIRQAYDSGQMPTLLPALGAGSD